MTKDVLRIGFVSHSSGLRGAERALLEAIDGLRDYPVNSIVFIPGEGPLVDELRSMGIEYSFYTAIPWVTTRRTIWRTLGKLLVSSFYTLQLVQQLKDHNCQIVYSNSLSIAMGAWAAKLAHIPHLWHIHEFGYEDHGMLFDLGNQITKQVLRKIGGFFIVNSYAVARKYSRLINSQAFDQHNKVIYQSVTIPPLDSGFEWHVPHYETTILLVGALHKNKGQADAILALHELRKRGFQAGLVLVGDGDDRFRLQQLVNELDIHEWVHFIGLVENVSNWYALADIVLVCSRMEAFGRIVVEAMLYRKPLVATNTGGLGEIIEDEITGLHYELGNIEDLSNKIERIIRDKALASELADRACAWATPRFEKERYGKELFEILATLNPKG